jgi:oligopeptide transport system permease protein
MTEQSTRPRGLWSDAWRDLRRRPMFLIAVVLIAFLVVMSLFPGLFTAVDPAHKDLSHSREAPSAHAWFGYDVQGRDIYARVIYGARWSILVGVSASLLTVLIGGTLGILAGYLGGWLDGLLSRIADVFFGLPFVLGAIVILSSFRSAGVSGALPIVGAVVLSIALLSWPVAMRIMRSAAISAKSQDYVKAARALGASTWRILLKHLLPNCLAPVLVYATIALGAFIGVEATLSFLGIGLRDPAVSWGVMISDARDYLRVAPHLLFFPAGFLVVTVLSFVMLGDAVRDALDPKLR